MPINKIVKVAKKFGFKLIREDRWKIKKKSDNLSINVPYDFANLSKDKTILKQIQKNYPDVIEEDLITRYFELGFYKQ